MTRAEQAGIQMGLAIVEMVNLMYQNATAMRFLKGVVGTIMAEIKLRLKR